MSAQQPTPYGSTPFVVGGVSTANSALTVTVPADPAALGETGRQAMITAITVRQVNDSSSAVTASALVEPTLTNTQNAATGAATTITYVAANGLGAWTATYILSEDYGMPGLPIVPGQSAVLTVPALGAGVLAEAVVVGYYV
jgi:hypothetical protein